MRKTISLTHEQIEKTGLPEGTGVKELTARAFCQYTDLNSKATTQGEDGQSTISSQEALYEANRHLLCATLVDQSGNPLPSSVIDDLALAQFQDALEEVGAIVFKVNEDRIDPKAGTDGSSSG